MSDDELYSAMKELDDFESFPVPSSWFKKYNIPLREAVAPKEFIESNYTLRRAVEVKDLPPLIIDEPQRDGALVEVPKEEEIKVDVVSRPFEWDSNKPFPAMLPALKEIEEKDISASSSA
jgi:hypothetical protein